MRLRSRSRRKHKKAPAWVEHVELILGVKLEGDAVERHVVVNDDTWTFVEMPAGVTVELDVGGTYVQTDDTCDDPATVVRRLLAARVAYLGVA